MTSAGRLATAALASLALAATGCGGGGSDTEKTTTASAPPAQQTTADTHLVGCLKSNGWSVKPSGAGALTVTKPGSDERAVIRTYPTLSAALRAGHAANLDLDQIISRQTIEYVKPGTGQIKIAVETCS
jgi:hypothetical protein